MMLLKNNDFEDLLSDLILLIENTKSQVVSHVNSSLTVLFWHVGKRVLN